MMLERIGYALSSLGLVTAASCTFVPAGDADEPEQSHEVAPAPGEAAPAAPELAAKGTPEAVARLYARVEDARAAQRSASPELAEPGASSTPSVRTPLPGRAARTVLHQEVNEAENLFFTEDGRLFVSGTEDIYEIERAADGTFTKTDHFHEDCIVEGIVRSGDYLYGVCWTLQSDLSVRSFLLGGQLTDRPEFRILGPLDTDAIANGMTVDPEGRVYVTYTTGEGQIARLTFSEPLQLERKEIWANDLPNVNGIKYYDGAFYVTLLSSSLTGQFARIAVLPDGTAGKPEILYERWLTVLDDVEPFEGGFIITDFLAGTLIFWDPKRGAYAETPGTTFYGPTSLAVGRPPMFSERQLIVAEKGNFLVRDERRGDLLSKYQLP